VSVPADFVAGKTFNGLLGLRCQIANYILKVDESAFSTGNAFQTVEINGCNLAQQPDFGFMSNFMQLKQIILQRASNINSFGGIPSQSSLNQITIFGSSGLENLDDARVSLPGLKILWLNGNTFTDFSAERTLNSLAGASFNSLNQLRLDENRLTVVPPTVHLFTRLDNLYIGGNQIRVVTDGALWFPNTSNVTVFVDTNVIERIEAGAFAVGIRSLSLTDNKLTKFDSAVFKLLLDSFEMKNWGPVSLKGNLFMCDCHLEWLIKDHRHLLSYIVDATCSNSTSFNDLSPDSYAGCPVNEFTCSPGMDGNYSAGACNTYYYACSGGYAYKMYCPGYMVYDEKIDACVNPVGCY